ncbi:PKD domain-containing protein [Actinoplanes sp. NPDC049681]|uniref:PKD domain-containing protein n=1 Tax=Actinoplanes sp. NPDC049681 TaxID=3363905 RepID=UPI0037B352AF
MNIRLSRPLLAAVAGGALLATGAVGVSPAFASGTSSVAGAALTTNPSRTPPPVSAPPPPSPSTSVWPSDDPGNPGPSWPDPSDPAPDPSDPATSPTPGPSDPAPDPSDPGPGPSDPGSDPSDPTPDPSGPTDPASDTTAPTGVFALSTTSLWVGQRVALIQGPIHDDGSPAEAISRVVDWGDGTSSTIVAGQAPVEKQYTKNGTYTVTLTLTDAAGNSSTATASADTVKVTTPGTFTLDKRELWPGQELKVTIGAVPAGTTGIRLDWGDGSATELSGRNQSVTGIYYHRDNGGLVHGQVTLRATFTNDNGPSSALAVGKVTVKKDTWKPVVKVKKPESADRLSSWKYARGTVEDKGAGVPYVYVLAARFSGTSVYCYTPQHKWKRLHSIQELGDCVPVVVKASEGKWSLKLSNLKKGTLRVEAKAWDWADNESKPSAVKAEITRS